MIVEAQRRTFATVAQLKSWLAPTSHIQAQQLGFRIGCVDIPLAAPEFLTLVSAREPAFGLRDGDHTEDSPYGSDQTGGLGLRTASSSAWTR
ncbi:hypothetical protein [Streptomyces sp. TE33382]